MQKKSITLEMFFELFNLELKTEYRQSDGMFTTSGNYVEVKDRGILRYEYGVGKTANLATRDYAKQIAGKTIVVHAYRDTRREIQVPDYIK